MSVIPMIRLFSSSLSVPPAFPVPRPDPPDALPAAQPVAPSRASAPSATPLDWVTAWLMQEQQGKSWEAARTDIALALAHEDEVRRRESDRPLSPIETRILQAWHRLVSEWRR